MNRFLGIALAVLLVFGFAASALAGAVEAKGDTKITLDGMVRVRGFFQTNTDFDSDIGDNYSIYETTVKLGIHAQITPNTEAKITIRDTKSNGDDDFTWGSSGGDAKGVYTKGGNVGGYSDMDKLAFTEAWIKHTGTGLLGFNAGIKIGHMPLKLGNGLFYDHTKHGEDAIVLFMDPTKELNVALVGAKFYEGTSTTNNDDANAYVALFNYKVSEVNVSGDVTYLDDQGYAGTTKGLHFWNIGLRGDTKVAGLGLKADVELQTGKAKAATDTKYKGYAVLLGADYTVNNIELGLTYAYGSGDKSATTDKYEGFVTLLDNKQKYSWIAEYRVPAGSGTAQQGLNNTQYVKASAGTKLTKDLDATLDLYWLRANKVEGLTYKKKDLGYEVDWLVNYEIDKNLKYFVEGGYLFAGDFYKNFSTGGKDPDNPWAVRHGVVLTF